MMVFKMIHKKVSKVHPCTFKQATFFYFQDNLKMHPRLSQDAISKHTRPQHHTGNHPIYTMIKGAWPMLPAHCTAPWLWV